MMLLVSSVELLTLYVALELASYSLYGLVPLRSGANSQTEAGIKYLSQRNRHVGSDALRHGLPLCGCADNPGQRADSEAARSGQIAHGLGRHLLTLSGFFFKLALFPFHVWAPGVYQAAANQVTAFVATATKVTAMPCSSALYR